MVSVGLDSFINILEKVGYVQKLSENPIIVKKYRFK